MSTSSTQLHFANTNTLCHSNRGGPLSKQFASVGVLFISRASLAISKVFLPTVVNQQMQLQDFHMLRFFVTATGVRADANVSALFSLEWA